MGDTLGDRVKQMISLDRSTLVLDSSFSNNSAAVRSVLGTQELTSRFSSVLLPYGMSGDVSLNTIPKDLFIGVDAHEEFAPVCEYASPQPVLQEVIPSSVDKLYFHLPVHAEQGDTFVRWPLRLRINGKDHNKEKMPTDYCVGENIWRAVQCARLAQKSGLVPLLELDILREGDHALKETYAVTSRVLDRLFEGLARADVSLEGMMLGVQPVLYGLDNLRGRKMNEEDFAHTTLTCLTQHVPYNLGGFLFIQNTSEKGLEFDCLRAMCSLSSAYFPTGVNFGFSYPLASSYERSDPEFLERSQKFLKTYRKDREEATTEGCVL